MNLDPVALSFADVHAEVVPGRGGLVTSLRVDGRDVLFLDRATLDDPTKNVRGGIPILFPFAGKLPQDRFAPAGTTITQHGFARKRPWSIAEQRPDFLRLTFVGDETTRAQYPYAFELDYGVRLLPRGLQVELAVHNAGHSALPIAPGWHPYFRCPSDLKPRVTGDVAGLASQTLASDAEFDFGLAAPASGRAQFEIPALGLLRLSFSPAMRHLQLWSLPGRDFICLEPFYGPENTIHTAQRLEVPAAEARDLWMRIELV
jgi:galactose mutarotase-like enzyme